MKNRIIAGLIATLMILGGSACQICDGDPWPETVVVPDGQ